MLTGKVNSLLYKKYFNKSQLYEEIDRCRKILNANGITEINIGNICEEYPHISVRYEPFETPGLRGMVIFSTGGNPINRIFINSLLPSTEQHFHSIHEYLHIYLHSDIGGNDITCFENGIKNNQDSGIEWQANEGAAELIMPYKEFIPWFYQMFTEYSNGSDYWKLMYDDFDVTDVLADHYKVSVPVICNRISSLAYEIDQFCSGIPIDDVEILAHNKQVKRGISATDYLKIIRTIQVRNVFR